MVPRFEQLEDRTTPTAPNAPVITEPSSDGQIVSSFDVHMEIDPLAYFDADGHPHQATNWQIRETQGNGGAAVWEALNVSDPLSRVHIHLGDGQFVGTLNGQTSLLPNHDYVLYVSVTDTNAETSANSLRPFHTASEDTPVPGAGLWIVREGYRLEPAATAGAFRLPVNIAFVPNPGSSPNDPFYYVAELYGSIQVVRRNGVASTYATGLLDYNPSGPISGVGEQGLTGIVVDPQTGDLFVTMLWDNGSPPGGTVHYPKVERLSSSDGGLTMSSRSVILNMQPETQGQSHQISNITVGPDNKLYVHMGDGFNAGTALNLDQFRGKVLRMNKDGTPPTDNPFYDASNGINSRDYVYSYGHRNPFGGAWREANGRHYVVENGNGLDRMVDLVAGQSYGWAGSDTALVNNSLYVWNPATAPVNMAFIQPGTFGGSLYPPEMQDTAAVSLSGPTYAAGPQARGKRIEFFPNLNSFGGDGKLSVPPVVLVKYNGTGRATVSALAAGPDGLYFADLYRDDGSGGATAAGANVYRVRYVDFAPTDLAANPGNGQAALFWEPHPMADSYNVYRYVAHGDPPVLVAAGVTGDSFLDTGLTNGVEYHYFLRGVNEGGESQDSSVIHVQPNVSANQVPTIVNPASANPNPAPGTTTNLSVLGGDDGGEANLIYSWAAVAVPLGAAQPTFSLNGANAAKNTVATFYKAGNYRFRVFVRDAGNLIAKSKVDVLVTQTVASLLVSPGLVVLNAGEKQQFSASARDQFNHPMASQPPVSWSLGGGSIGTISPTGLYSSPTDRGGSAVVLATNGQVTGVASVKVDFGEAPTGFAAAYFDNMNLTGHMFARTDRLINFNWGTGVPEPGMGVDTYSARWSGKLKPRYSETYTFLTTSDDGIRLWVNGQLVINQWNDHAPTVHTATVALLAGTKVDLRLEYYENGGGATAMLEWQSTSQPREFVPGSRVYAKQIQFPIFINFQDLTSQGFVGYLSDTGSSFGDRGNRYRFGWNADNSANGRNRNAANSPDERYDTITHMQRAPNPNAFWELEVPVGAYLVRLVAGDPSNFDSTYKVDVEGFRIIDAQPTTNVRFFENTILVYIRDGRLTLTNAPGAVNNKIAFLEVTPTSVYLAGGGEYGRLTERLAANGPVRNADHNRLKDRAFVPLEPRGDDVQRWTIVVSPVAWVLSPPRVPAASVAGDRRTANQISSLEPVDDSRRRAALRTTSKREIDELDAAFTAF